MARLAWMCQSDRLSRDAHGILLRFSHPAHETVTPPRDHVLPTLLMRPRVTDVDRSITNDPGVA